MTTSRADLLAGVDMEGGEGFCDSIYNFLKNQGKDINLLTNSGFGVWSQSDANKGLGTLVYDNLAIATFEVGEAITTAAPPGGSGATGKVITNIGTTLVLGACVGRFNDDEQITGAVSGATADVNMPDAAVGVDQLRNGEFEAGTGGWTAVSSAVLSSVAGGYVGNCLKILEGGANNPRADSVVTSVTAGKIYKLVFWHKDIDTTGDDPSWYVWDDSNGVNISGVVTEPANAAWTKVTFVFEAPAGCSLVKVIFRHNALLGDADAYYFDEASLYEITPCCTGADILAFDGCQKHATQHLYRQHNDGGTLTKDGSFYSLKMVPTTSAGRQIIWNAAFRSNEEFFQQYAGRPITIGVWAKTWTANHFKIRIYDTGYTDSAFHTGGGDWEWLELTITMDATPIQMGVYFYHAIAGNIDGSTIIYVSQPILVFGTSLGEGMYQPKCQEVIPLEVLMDSNKFHGWNPAGAASAGWEDLNVEADSDARLPKGCKAVYLMTGIHDSGSAASNPRMYGRRDAVGNMQYANNLEGWQNNAINRIAGRQECGYGGDFDVYWAASGGGALTFDYFRYTTVQVN